ncbi:hypothetical protein KIW84_052137 [Lathyrus oleraceus]|uniref:Uncharacterized protein n=1 Tax=Pisum sativum TaxID=3888 RepID=A0A9D4WP02_PEA|nr:hypothetical protein KIW84_052137 [Pisum sativum]
MISAGILSLLEEMISNTNSYGCATALYLNLSCLEEAKQMIGTTSARQPDGTAPSSEGTGSITRLASTGSFDSKWQQFLDPGESVIMISMVKKLQQLQQGENSPEGNQKDQFWRQPYESSSTLALDFVESQYELYSENPLRIGVAS